MLHKVIQWVTTDSYFSPWTPRTAVFAFPSVKGRIPHFILISDEVGALVFDIGSYSIRAGYAGEDMPKVKYMIEFLSVVLNCWWILRNLTSKISHLNPQCVSVMYFLFARFRAIHQQLRTKASSKLNHTSNHEWTGRVAACARVLFAKSARYHLPVDRNSSSSWSWGIRSQTGDFQPCRMADPFSWLHRPSRARVIFEKIGVT